MYAYVVPMGSILIQDPHNVLIALSVTTLRMVEIASGAELSRTQLSLSTGSIIGSEVQLSSSVIVNQGIPVLPTVS